MQPDEARFIKVHLKHRKIDSPILFTTNPNAPINKRMLDVLMKNYGELAKLPEDKRHFHVIRVVVN